MMKKSRGKKRLVSTYINAFKTMNAMRFQLKINNKEKHYFQLKPDQTINI